MNQRLGETSRHDARDAAPSNVDVLPAGANELSAAESLLTVASTVEEMDGITASRQKSR